MLERTALASMLFFSACHLGAAPARVEEHATAAAAVDRRDGPLTVDASGRWLPGLDAAARFVAAPGATVRVLALDVGARGAAVALAHDGTVSLGRDTLAVGKGVVVVRLDADARLLWRTVFEGAPEDLTAIRLTADGSIVIAGHGDPASTLIVADALDGTQECRARLAPELGRLVAVAPREGRGHFIAGAMDGPLPGAEPWQVWIESAEGRRQIVGGDQPIRVWSIDASMDGWAFITGSFAGTLAVAGLPAIGSALRTPFVTAMADDGSVAWIAPIFPPRRGSTMEPVALTVEDGLVHLGLATAAPGGSSSLIEARLDGDGSVHGSCQLMTSSRPIEVRDMAVSAELTTVLGRFGGELELAGRRHAASGQRRQELYLFGGGCKLLGRLEARAGEALVAVRPLGEQVVVGVDALEGGRSIAAEVRWYRK